MLYVFISLFVFGYLIIFAIGYGMKKSKRKSDMEMSMLEFDKKHPIGKHIVRFFAAIIFAIIFFGIYLTLPMTWSDM